MTDELPTAVLFDMDGTLIDSEGLWFASEIAVMTALGAAWTAQDQALCLGGPLERVAEYMRDRAGSDLPADQIGVALVDEMEHRLRTTPLVWQPGAQELLRECREAGIPTALVSASWSRLINAVQDRIEAELGMRAFDTIVAGDEVANSKPHPEPYSTAARALGVPPHACLALEDSPTGAASAVAAGCRVVAIPHIAVIEDPSVTVVPTLAGRTLRDLWTAVA